MQKQTDKSQNSRFSMRNAADKINEFGLLFSSVLMDPWKHERLKLRHMKNIKPPKQQK